MSRVVLLLVCGTLVLTTGLAATAGATTRVSTTTPCGTISGPPTPIPAGSTRTYVIEVVQVPCPFAKNWAGKILREQTTPGGIFPHPKGPSGWQCSADTLVKRTAVDGFCGSHGSIRSFFWSPEGAD